MQKEFDVLAIGNALVDLVVEVPDKFFTEAGLKKSRSNMLQKEQAEEMLHKVHESASRITKVPGGSAANVVALMSVLGSKGAYIGGLGEDDHARFYAHEMSTDGVFMAAQTNKTPTGYAITFVSDDAERTFAVHLGAATQFSPVNKELIAKSKVLHLEGYLFTDPVLKKQCLQAMMLAKQHNTLISLDVSDPGIIESNKEFFISLLTEVDIVFANEDEAKSLTGKDAEEAVTELGERCMIAVVKIGARGSFICDNGALIYVPAQEVDVKDTNGAGDTYAAGFLHGYMQGWDVQKCAMLATNLASEIVQILGARATGKDKDVMKSHLSL